AGSYHYAGKHELGVAACRRALDRAGAGLEPVDQAQLLANIALGTRQSSPQDAASTGALARDVALASGNPSLIAYTNLICAIVRPREAAVACDQAYRVASEVRNRFYTLLASEGMASMQRAALGPDAAPDEVDRALSSSVAVCRDYYRDGRVAHAHQMGSDLARPLFERDLP